MIPQPGIYPSTDVAVYRSWEAANFSFLKHFRNSPLHARAEQVHPKEPTPAMLLGSALHAAMLEPGTFAERYCEGPEVDRRTKAGKATWSAFEVENAHREILKADAWDRCLSMQSALHHHPLHSQILSEGLKEVSIAWDDPATGIRCKARIDLLRSWDNFTWLFDLKKTTEASKRGFKKAVSNFDIHCQAAHYLSGMNALDKRPRRFGVIAIEEKAPYASATYEIEECDIEQGGWEVGEWMKALQTARETNIWPGYPLEIQSIGLPIWRRKEYEDGE